MKCALCLKEDDLVKSHILPEFFFKMIYDEDHKYFAMSTSKTERISKKRSGIYEKLLCAACEKEISIYDDYAAKVLFGGVKRGVEYKKDRIIFIDIDYHRFKLFQLSLLWRFAASKSKETHKIILGPHQERIRKMLINKDPGEQYQYGCYITFSPKAMKLTEGMIYPLEAIGVKIDGHQFYRGLLGGLLWAFIVSSHSKSFPHPEVFLSKSGILPVLNSGDAGYKLVVQIIREFDKSGKLDELGEKYT